MPRLPSAAPRGCAGHGPVTGRGPCVTKHGPAATPGDPPQLREATCQPVRACPQGKSSPHRLRQAAPGKAAPARDGLASPTLASGGPAGRAGGPPLPLRQRHFPSATRVPAPVGAYLVKGGSTSLPSDTVAMNSSLRPARPPKTHFRSCRLNPSVSLAARPGPTQPPGPRGPCV